MAHFNETCIKNQDIRRVEGNAFCGSLPFDCTSRTTGLSVFVNVNAEFFRETLGGLKEAIHEWEITIVTQQKLVVSGPEHAHRAT